MPTKPEAGQPILVEVGGRQMMEIRYPLRVMRDLEGEGISLLRDGQQGMFNVITSPERMIQILHAGLKTKQPEITIDWVADNVNAGDIAGLMPYLVYGMTGQWAGETVPEKNEAAANPSTGSPSGLTAATTSASPKPNSGRSHSQSSAH